MNDGWMPVAALAAALLQRAIDRRGVDGIPDDLHADLEALGVRVGSDRPRAAATAAEPVR